MEKESDYIPQIALIVYKNEKDDYYVESREFLKTKEQEFRLSTGEPITVKTINQLSSIADNKKEITLHSDSVIKNNILYFSFSKNDMNVVWYIPEHKRKLKFKKDLGITATEFSLPPLIMSFQNGSLKVFAVKVKHSVIVSNENQIQLYRAPFLNMYIDGSVCMGNNSFKQETTCIQELMDDVENQFFNSPFTHQIEEESVKGGLIPYLQNYKDEKFDINLLLKHTKELHEIWK